eukprot:gene187-4433_t
MNTEENQINIDKESVETTHIENESIDKNKEEINISTLNEVKEEDKKEEKENIKEEKKKIVYEGYVETDLHIKPNEEEEKEGLKRYFFYIIKNVLYIKKDEKDIWFEYCIPISSIYELKDIEMENTFKICTIPLTIICKTNTKEEFTNWISKLSSIEKSNNLENDLKDCLNEYYKKTKNIDNYLNEVLSLFLKQSLTFETKNENDIFEKIYEILKNKEEEEFEIHFEKSNNPLKKQIQINEFEFEKIKQKSERYDKLENDNFELNKKYNKLQITNDLKIINEEELTLANKKISKFQEFIKLKDNKIKELINSEAKYHKDMKNIEQRMDEIQKSEERIKKEKLIMKSVETKNKELELFFQTQAAKVSQLSNEFEQEALKAKNLEAEKKSIENTLQKFKEREKQLVSVIQMYEQSNQQQPKESSPTPLSPSTNKDQVETKKNRKSFSQPKELEKSESFFGRVGGLFNKSGKSNKEPVIIHDKK